MLALVSQVDCDGVSKGVNAKVAMLSLSCFLLWKLFVVL